jgi:hypothetical protein
MSKLLSFVFGISIAGVATAHAMPFHPEIYDGYYRTNYRSYYRGYYRPYYDSYYHGPGPSLMVDQGACSGRHMYRVCNVYGECWAACD